MTSWFPLRGGRLSVAHGRPRGLAASALLAAALSSLSGASHSEPATAVQSSLDRPAISVRAPQKAVLLGAALAGKRVVAVGERGIVALSDDGGRNWRQAPTPTSVTLTAVRFLDAKRGWIIGHGGVVLSSSDGGASWTRQLDGRRAAQIVLDAARTGSDAKLIAEAERLVADGPDKPFLDLVVSDQRLLAVGAYGLALASTDGGQTWSSWVGRLPNPQGLHLYAVRQRDNTLVLAGERGLVLLSQDSGQTFQPVQTPYNGSFFSVELLTGPNDIVLAGLRGNVLRSRDSGVSWAPLSSPAPVSITATTVDQRGELLAVNQAGLVLSLQGDRLVPLSRGTLPPINGLLATGPDSLLALSIEGALPVPVKP